MLLKYFFKSVSFSLPPPPWWATAETANLSARSALPGCSCLLACAGLSKTQARLCPPFGGIPSLFHEDTGLQCLVKRSPLTRRPPSRTGPLGRAPDSGTRALARSFCSSHALCCRGLHLLSFRRLPLWHTHHPSPAQASWRKSSWMTDNPRGTLTAVQSLSRV